MPKQPLAEVFGFPIDNKSPAAKRGRDNALCPFGNKVPNCTKDKANNPLGVCSIFDGTEVVITCPVRFREQWIIAADAAAFFFPTGARWTTLTEVRLKDKHGGSAGNIDVVLCSYNDRGKVTDFGALEVQAVYISGNVRNPFEHYMENPVARAKMDWSGHPNYPNPDYLSSSRKRLAPQLIFKGGIFQAWKKKTAVALNRGFFETLPTLQEVDPTKADIAWLVYDLVKDTTKNTYSLQPWKAIYTKFAESLEKITRSEPGDVADFMEVLQDKVDDKLENQNPPDTEVISAPF
ncbi:MAG: NotI family restriction endonuclease [Phycisphaerales bacterium]